MTTESQNTVPPAQDDELVALPEVEKVIKSLTKVIHGKKLYAENNPRLSQFREEFEESLRQFFKREDELTLGIEQFEIVWRGQRVYENDKRDDSIAFMLHKDGIGEITLGPGSVGKETEHLTHILADEYHNLNPEEDVVTRFWNADFECITYRVLDDYLSIDIGNITADAGEGAGDMSDHEELLPSLADKGRVIVRQSDPLESIDGYLKRLIMRTCDSDDEEQREEYFQSMVGSFFTVSNDEYTQCVQELDRENASDGLADFCDGVLVFTLLQENPSAVRDVSGVLERIIEFAVEDGDAHTLTRLLSQLRAFREGQSLAEHVEKLCDKLLDQLTDRELINQIGARLDKWDDEAEDIVTYFRALGEPAVEPMLRVLHRAEGSRLHKEICNIIVECSADVPYVIERLDIDNPVIAVDAVYLADKADLKALTPKLQELLFYPDRRVKSEMVALVSRMEDDEAVELLLNMINDEDKMTRCRAIDAVSKRNNPRVRDCITDLAFAKDFAERDEEEQEEIFKALGRVGNEDTVEKLKPFTEKRLLMQPGKARDNKFLAIRALESIEHPAAMEMLEQFAQDSNSLVQTRATRALEALRRRLQGQMQEQGS